MRMKLKKKISYTYEKILCKFQVGRRNGFKMATFFV